MQIRREEIRTGLLVVASLAIVTGVLLAIGAPGVFKATNTYRIYLDNAAGLNQGAPVMLAGRKIGQVTNLFSPVPMSDRPEGYKGYETLVQVQVDRSAQIYNKVAVHMLSTSLLGQEIIDFSNGDETSKLAPDGSYFIGIRSKDFAEAISDAVNVIQETVVPVAKQAQETMKELSATADNLKLLTAPGSNVDQAVVHFRQFGDNLVQISSSTGSLQKSLNNVQSLTGPDGHLDQALSNIDRVTKQLTDQDRISKTMQNLQEATATLNATINNLTPRFNTIATNLEQATDTVKHQPWRLIYPVTKSYPETRPPLRSRR